MILKKTLLLLSIFPFTISALAFGPLKSVEQCLENVKKNPKSDNAFVELGEAYLRSKQYKKALASFQNASTLNPKNAESYFGQSQAFYAMEDYQKALDMALIAEGLLPFKNRYKSQAGLIYYKTGDYDQAIKYFNDAVQISTKKNAFYFSMLGNCYMKKNQYEKAIEMFLKSSDVKPWDKRIFADIGRAYYKAGNKSKGDEYRKMAGEAWQTAFEEKKYAISQGWSAYQKGKYDQAIKLFQQDSEKDRANPDPLIGLVYSYLKKGKPKEALHFADLAVKADDKYSRSFSSRAFTFEKLNDQNKALQDYQKALEIEPADNFSRERIAMIYYRQKKYKEASFQLEKVLETQEGNAYLYKILGQSYIEIKEYEKAMDNLQKALKMAKSEEKQYLRSKFSFAAYQFGIMLEKSGKTDESQKIFKNLVEIAPDTKYGRLAKNKIK
ncbi:MAG: tetratricopeptide repeat protein [Spirochaetes bacterium]|nr:tetratricopeptide repeat protein [Spirochaetota bacterium]